jgi:hypothetical protein
VIEGLVNPADVLQLQDGTPVPRLTRDQLGFGFPGDDLNGISSSTSFVAQDNTFVVLFSVTDETQGLVGPDPGLVNQNLPYNVADQAAKNQVGGDQFMSLVLVTRNGPMPTNGVASAVDNNTLVKNNFDEGGSDFGANPETSAEDNTTDPGDDLDGTKPDNTNLIAGLGEATYYTAARNSPSLPKLSQGVPPSGATIFFVAEPGGATADVQIYARFDQLGLVQEDDINALIVFDDNNDGQFNGSDQVIFSLTDGSPSLQTIPGSNGDIARANLFSITAQPGAGPVLFLSAIQLGLGTGADDLDALDVLLCNNPFACANLHAIRSGAIPTVSEWGVVGMALLLIVVASLVYGHRKRALA